MKTTQRIAAASAAALFLTAAGFASAQEASEPIRQSARMVMTACDTDKDGMVSKQEFMKHMEKMFDKMDGKKMGKLDTKQVEKLLADLMKSGA